MTYKMLLIGCSTFLSATAMAMLKDSMVSDVTITNNTLIEINMKEKIPLYIIGAFILFLFFMALTC